MVIIQTITNYNKTFTLTWNQSIHRITVSVINTLAVQRCRRIQKSDNQNSPYVNQLLLFMSTIFEEKWFFLSNSFFFPSLSRCKSFLYFTLEQWLLVLSIYIICLWMLRAFLWLVKKKFYSGIMTKYTSLLRRFLHRDTERKKKRIRKENACTKHIRDLFVNDTCILELLKTNFYFGIMTDSFFFFFL